METVSVTSLWIAAMRAMESERPDRLFEDPWARLLAGSQYARAQALVGPSERALNPVVLRTSFGDAVIEEAVARGGRQIVLLGVGMDTRAFRLGLPPDVALYELDFPGVFEHKDRVLAGAGARPTCRRVTVAADLTGRWAEGLMDAGFRSGEPAVWLVEGVLCYLDREEADRLIGELTGATVPGSALVFDAYPAALFAAVSMQGWRESLRGGTARFRPMEDPVEWIGGRGWSVRAFTRDDIRSGLCPWISSAPSRAIDLFPAEGWLVRAEARPGPRRDAEE